jgi:PhnB protein
VELSTHLCFDGECEVAFRTYERLLGGNVTTMLAYGDSPMAEQVPPEWQKRIVHASLELDGHTLLGADVFPDDFERPRGFFVTLSVKEVDRAKLLFEALADGGEVRMPFQETFWSAGFGVLVDRFGIPWEINSEVPPSDA